MQAASVNVKCLTFASTSNDIIHLANSAVSSNSCELFQESMCLSMEHSIFALNPSNKIAFGNETWVLDTRVTDHIVHSLTLFYFCSIT